MSFEEQAKAIKRYDTSPRNASKFWRYWYGWESNECEVNL